MSFGSLDDSMPPPLKPTPRSLAKSGSPTSTCPRLANRCFSQQARHHTAHVLRNTTQHVWGGCIVERTPAPPRAPASSKIVLSFFSQGDRNGHEPSRQSINDDSAVRKRIAAWPRCTCKHAAPQGAPAPTRRHPTTPEQPLSRGKPNRLHLALCRSHPHAQLTDKYGSPAGIAAPSLPLAPATLA